MKSCFLALLLFISLAGLAQPPVIDKISTEICNQLKNFKSPEQVTHEEYSAIVKQVKQDNADELRVLRDSFLNNPHNSYFEIDLYLEHVLQIKCEEFRILDMNLDGYLSILKDKRQLYQVAKELIYLLQDNEPNQKIKKYLSDSLSSALSNKFLNDLKKQLQEFQLRSTKKIYLEDFDGYMIRTRFLDFFTKAPLLQIDLIFSYSDKAIVDKIQLTEAFELDPPPPPPPPQEEPISPPLKK